MKINQIKMTNVKGRTATVKLGPVNVVHGSNWSGKSTVLTAVRLGLLGYDPKLGKRNQDTFALCSGDSMHVELTMDDGCGINRAWTMRSGSVKALTAYTIAGGATVEGVRPTAFPETQPMLLDVREYFALTAQQRREHILSMLDLKAAGLSDDELTSAIKRVVVDGHDEAAQDEIGQIVEEIDFWCGDRDAHDTPLSEWMAGNTARLKERVSRHEEARQQAASILQSIAQERAAHPEGPPEDQTKRQVDLGAQLDEMSRELGGLLEREGRWQQKLVLMKRLADLPPVRPEEIERLREEHAAARKALDEFAPLPDRKAQLQILGRALDGARGEHSSQVTLLDELKKKHDKASKLDKCPTCGSDAHVAKMKRKLKSDYDAERKVREDVLKVLAGRVAELEVEYADMKKLAESRSEGAEQREKLVQRVRLAETILRPTEQKAERRAVVEAELRGYDDAADPGTTAELAGKMAEVRAAIQQCAELQKQRGKITARDAQHAEAEQKKGDSEKRLAAAKACAKVVADAQQDVIDRAFGPFIQTVRKFTDGVLDFLTPQDQAEGRAAHTIEYRDGDIGYVREGAWVSHETFSGSETALTYAGLGVALAARSPIKLVMLDEVLLDKVSKRKLVERMSTLIRAGVIDQFVVADVNKDWETSECSINFVDAK